MSGMPAIKILDRAAALTEYFSPKVIGEVNDVYVKVAKIKGEDIPWHNHAGEDELFYIIDGSLLFEIEGEESFTMERGDLFVVKRGVNHRVSSTEECSILLIENKGTAHLGDTESEITKSVEEQLEEYSLLLAESSAQV
jgi:mannose-6-phosphate isomerase-like protein (cupin superfamily)